MSYTRSQRNRATVSDMSDPHSDYNPHPPTPPSPPPHSATPPLPEPPVTEPPPAESSILANLPEDSALAILLTNNDPFYVHTPGKHGLDPITELTLMRSIDETIQSVPHTLITLYTHLTVAAVYERLGRDIPMEVQYTAVPNGQENPYNKQATAYGIDKLLDKASKLAPGGLPLLSHPKFNAHTYSMIQHLTGTRDNHMARLFLGSLLQTYLRNCEFLTQNKVKKGPRNQTYAAITQERLPQQPKPRRIFPLRPPQNTRYPCARCIATATILTTTEKKYTDQIQLRIRNRTLEDYEQSLPNCLRKRFHDIYITLTQGIPNHRESEGCPLSAQQEKRTAFSQAAPTRMTHEQANGLSSAVITACKQHNLCAKCGRSRTPASERFHRMCRADPRNCPPRREPDCINRTCKHTLHPMPSLWRADEFTIKCRQTDSSRTIFTPFC